MTTPVYLDSAAHDRVSQAVRKAEQATSGEIVTILADRSDGYTDIAMAWAGAAALIALGFLAAMPECYLDLYDRLTGGWSTAWNTGRWSAGRIFWLAGLVAALKFAGVMAIQLWQPLKFLLIPAPIKSARVRDRAVDCFKVGAERRTHGRTGVLIYLSMRERRAEIVADEAIAVRVALETWGDAMATMLVELKQGRVDGALITGVERVGTVLAEHFPRDDSDTNELPDRLIEL